MPNGTRGGSNDASLPLIAADDITSGTFNQQSAQVMKLGVGADSALDLIDATHPLPVTSPRGFGGAISQKVTTMALPDTAYAVPTSALASRATLLVQACDTNTDPVYIGGASVTAGTGTLGGIKLMPGQSLSLDLAGVALFAVAAVAGQQVATLEVAV